MAMHDDEFRLYIQAEHVEFVHLLGITAREELAKIIVEKMGF